MKKRLLALFLVLACLLSVCPLQVSALTPTSGHGSSPITYNPLYHSGEEHSNSETLTLSHSHKTYDPGLDEYLDWDAAVQEFRDYLKARDLEFTLYLRSNGPVEDIGDDDISDQLFAGALEHTGVSTEGDYLERHWDTWGANWNWSIVNGVYYYALNFTFSYEDAAWHQSIMDDAVADLLNTLNVYGASDYEKARTVYDYICDNVVYDYDRLEDDSYTLKYTAYAALVDGIAVCSGYATLFYRLMLELGVDARVISGTANGGNHSWNIVKLNGLYYNLDSTWDAGSSTYSWFLLSPNNFPDHYRWDAYNTAQFHASYPMSPANYDPTDPELPTPPDDPELPTPPDDPELPTPPDGAESGTFGDGLTWTLYEDGELHVSGNGAIPDYSGSSDSFVSPIAERIVRVVIEEGITSIGDFSFSGCYALTELEFPSTLVTLGNYSFEYCTALTSAYIPANVTVIGSAPFSGCSALTDLRVDSGNPNYRTDSCGVIYDQEMTRLIQMPGGFEGAYSIPNGVTELGQWSFEDCLSLTSVDIPESVTVIGQGTFSGAALTEVTIPSGVTILQKNLFYYCPTLSSVTIPVGVTTIEDGAFRDCPALTDVYYGGTQEQWNNIFIGADNSALNLASVHYSEGTEHEHSYTAVVTPPTCTEAGYTTYTCSCGDSYIGNYVDIAGHSWGEWEVSVPPTETVPGQEIRECSVCGETEAREIAPLVHTHSYTSETVTPPTCTEEGYTTYTCSCGDSYTANYVNPTGHNWSAWEVSVPPTETTPGQEIRECANCGETETRPVNPIVHIHSYTGAVTPPTCTQQGYTTYTCSCGDSYVSDYVEAAGHRWGAWQTIKPATQTQTGEELHECSVCHKVETRTVPMIPAVTFTDVPAGAWFTDAVNWAVTNNITSGTGNGAFSPDMACSRSQVVTFLWRAAGSPQPSGTNPFSDVTEGAWYYDAVLWAVENGITSGTTATTFAPDMPCSRSQVVTFLYRAAGAPEVSGTNPFSDATEGAWYYKAVLWAVENGITSGTTPTTFAPDMTCSRSQVVTFLYRAED